MKKPTTFKDVKDVKMIAKQSYYSFIIAVLLCLSCISANAQLGKAFSPRLSGGSIKVKGDVVLIGNTVVNRVNTSPRFSPSAPQNGVTYTGTVTNLATLTSEANVPFNGNGNNNDYFIEYSDIDNDGSTFSSTSADLLINNSCKKIVFAGLYWSAIYPYERSTNTGTKYDGSKRIEDWKNIKFKLPVGGYQNITADEVIFDGYNYTNVQNSFKDSPYVCFKNVTTLLQGLANADGTYTVANVRASRGKRNGGGAGGWTLVVVYESPTLSSKFISVFDGYAGVNPDSGAGYLPSIDFPVNGFQTLPLGFPVNAKIGVGALEGDNQLTGDSFQIKSSSLPAATPFTRISDAVNPDTNFFNATISNNGAHILNRNPNSTNTMGFDIDNVIVPNPLNSVIPNEENAATLRLTTNGDGFGAFVTTFAVDIIEPKITLTKEVFDYSTNPPTNMGNKDVTLGKELNYLIGFQNQGNDNATNFTITDVLPINTKFNYPADIVSLPADIVISGVTYKVTHTYDAATRTITFTIPKEFVEIGDPRYTIRLKVKVVESCSEISDVCSNIIQNTALSNYSGEYNKGVFGDKSLDSYTNCNIGIPQSTNFLVDVDDCKFEKNEVLCGTSIQIKAANGYSSYSWSTSPTGTPVIGTGQTLTVVKEGIYYVKNTALAPCLSIEEKFTVSLPNGLMENPVLPYARAPYAGNITQCPDTGKFLPNLFLCGAADFRDIKTGILGTGITIVWEKLDETSCSAVANDKCANENTLCTWKPVGSGPDYRADTKGQYRLTIRYQNNTCFNQFYFNVYKNELNPTITYNDIYCNTKGRIAVNGVPAGYEYSLTKNGTYQDSNIFSPINNPGRYTVYIKQKNVTTNPCIFEVSVDILDRKLDVETIVTQPICYGDKGSIKLNTSGVRGQYYYELFKNGTSVQKVGPVTNADYLFSNLDSGGYSFTVRTEDGCTYNNNYVGINTPASEIKAVPSIIKPLTDCGPGKILITTDPDWKTYSYFVNGSATFQNSKEIDAPTPGLYTIRVVDGNCEKTVTINVPNNPKPTYTVSHTNSNCYEDPAEIRINLTSPTTGYTMGYSINNGATYQTSPVFSNLQPGNYNVIVKYSVTYPITNWPYTETKDCFDPAQLITITGPTSSVTASAGVAELAGCGPLQAGQPTGLIRFTNVEGGVAPYQYSFDGGVTWQTSPQKYVVSSTVPYDLRVRDNNGCFYKIPYNVILDPKPEDPSIDNNITPIYNCDGSATATVVVNTPTTSNGTTYTYEYYMKTGSAAPVANTPITSNVFQNVPAGTHTVIVKYNVQTVSTYSNLLQEDFGRGGDTQSPGINSAYCWEKQDGNTMAFATCSLSDWHPWLMNDGDYVVTSALLPDHGPDFNWWLPKDHTAVLNNTPSVTGGRFLAVNIGDKIPKGAVLYSKTINDVIPDQDINVSLFMTNLLKITNNLESPQLTIQLVKGTQVIASQVMPSIPRDEKWHSSTDLAGGNIFKLNPGNNTSLEFQIISNSQVINGNDLAVDDILVYQIPKACGNEIEIPVVINTNGAFNVPTPGIQDAKCSTSNDGSITITANNFNTSTGFYYSIDNGLNWRNSTTSPVIIPGLGVGLYKVIVRNENNNDPKTCSFSFDSEIKAPQAIFIVLVDKTNPTCTTAGTITVTTVTGGTGSYQYQLSNSSGIVVVPFQANKTFSNVAQGTYKVQVKDANDCLSQPSAPITITNPTAPTATLAAATDWCYTPSNPASLVVSVTGGVGPYTYKLDNNAPITTNTFNNVAPGTHTIVVTDSNNCTATISNIIIAPQLQLSATLTQDLTCLVDGSITTVVSGGYGIPYTYTVSRNGGASTAVNSFPYTAGQAGNYVFTVTDSKGCTATSNTIVVSPKTTPTLTTNKTDITCYNANDGTITVTASNGATTVYTYAIKLSSAATYTTQSTNQFTGLAAGTYNIKVIDSKGCESAVSNVTIINPSAVDGSINGTQLRCSTSGTVAAVVTVTATGGSGSYQYSFNGTSNFTNTNTYSTSVAGTVTAYIKDANGCQFGPLSFTIGTLEPITDIIITDNGYDCSTTPVGGKVTITAVKTGVSNPINYQIISGPSGYNATPNSTGNFQGLAAGNYIFQATDTQTNCTFTKPYTISGIPAIVAGGSVTAPISCYGGTGNIQFTVSGVSTSGYDYVVRNSANTTVDSKTNQTASTVNLNNLSAGSYTITVTDIKTKCPATYSVTLTQPSAVLSITNAVGTNINCNNDNSQITVTATGGTPAYTYAYAINPSTVPTSAYASGSVFTIDTNSGANLAWDIYVKDANGCTAKRTVNITPDGTPSLTVSVDNQCTGSGSGFTITATPSSTSLAPLSYSIGGATG
ncbi:beta strand repeat-containing protein, partial [Flavobacterium hibisci]|uniref:beta strand repeat-containing protein n=1 Tax=Flavobacterium hibisci TaxID=1914462 RepID=UPI001CBBEA16